jgi:hypothetical protein
MGVRSDYALLLWGEVCTEEGDELVHRELRRSPLPTAARHPGTVRHSQLHAMEPLGRSARAALLQATCGSSGCDVEVVPQDSPAAVAREWATKPARRCPGLAHARREDLEDCVGDRMLCTG